jgi:hypothetical protein
MLSHSGSRVTVLAEFIFRKHLPGLSICFQRVTFMQDLELAGCISGGLRPRIYLLVYENARVGGSVVVSGECQDGVCRGERKNGMMEGENFQIQCCQVASHCIGCLSAVCLVAFPTDFFKLFVRNSHSKNSLWQVLKLRCRSYLRGD